MGFFSLVEETGVKTNGRFRGEIKALIGWNGNVLGGRNLSD